ncbi:hypothetical protein, partial [Ruthenibacterium lactatiformans]|uniref:hypothetical protein n=1 Tax=Ruthenibacterium lactatiformans TaxID=1550024 RepID=UPI0021097F81
AITCAAGRPFTEANGAPHSTAVSEPPLGQNSERQSTGNYDELALINKNIVVAIWLYSPDSRVRRSRALLPPPCHPLPPQPPPCRRLTARPDRQRRLWT